LSRLSTSEAKAYAEQVARHRGWRVNPDQSMTVTLEEGLARQSERYGKPYCPCRDVDGLDSDRDVICPCAYAAADIAEHGQCYCALFLSPLKDPASVQSIPERRNLS
jgi:ferredoxin-thioredoxin reductase catalytic subunit